MDWLLSLLREIEKKAVFQEVLPFRFCLFCAVSALSLVGMSSQKADVAPETLGRANLVLSDKVAAPSAAMIGLHQSAAILAIETSVDRGGRSDLYSDKSQESEEELQPLQKPKIDMEVLGGIALLLWVLRLRSFGN